MDGCLGEDWSTKPASFEWWGILCVEDDGYLCRNTTIPAFLPDFKAFARLKSKIWEFFQVSKALQYTCIFEYTSNGIAVSAWFLYLAWNGI